ncbi:MAG: hypothetical protein GY786_22300, partial [Proteobacteria bacterium]|nr:hypothetical protein [Pseudomonadota bacterium]
MLFLDGIYAKKQAWNDKIPTHHSPKSTGIDQTGYTISHRVASFLERQGILERDEENSYLELYGIDEDPMQQFIGCSVSYRIAVGPHVHFHMLFLDGVYTRNKHGKTRFQRTIA